MLITAELSQAKKTKGCAVTYRAAGKNIFGTCPPSCPLMSAGGTGSAHVDDTYLKAVLSAVPYRGQAFTYTHYPIRQWGKQWEDHQISGKPTTVVNYSADSMIELRSNWEYHQVPMVVAVPLGCLEPDWKVHWYGTLRIVRCPAEYMPIGCRECGGGVPLCARPHRDYAIGFTAHGSEAAKVGLSSPGGCYAAGGHVGLHWRKLAEKQAQRPDGELLRAFADYLPPGTVLRHHVAGDLGRE